MASRGKNPQNILRIISGFALHYVGVASGQRRMLKMRGSRSGGQMTDRPTVTDTANIGGAAGRSH